MIEEVTIYKTEDGKKFSSREEAEEHSKLNEELMKIICFTANGNRTYATGDKPLGMILLKNDKEVTIFTQVRSSKGLRGPGFYRWEPYVGWTKLPDIMFKAMIQYVVMNSV